MKINYHLLIIWAFLLVTSYNTFGQQKKWVLGPGLLKEDGSPKTAQTNSLFFVEADMSIDPPTYSKRNVGTSINSISSFGISEAHHTAVDKDGDVVFYVFANSADGLLAAGTDVFYFVALDPQTGRDEVFATLTTSGQGASSVKNMALFEDTYNEGFYHMVYKNSAVNNRNPNDLIHVYIDGVNKKIVSQKTIDADNINEGMAVSGLRCNQANRFLYYSKLEDNKISMFSIEFGVGGPSDPVLRFAINNESNTTTGQGDLELSPNGKHLAFANFRPVGNINNDVYLFDVSPQTGQLMNYRNIRNGFGPIIGVCFSPDSKRLYLTQGGATGIPTDLYNLAIPNTNYTIQNEDREILGITGITPLELAANGWIIIGARYQNKMYAITNPNETPDKTNFSLASNIIDNLGVCNTMPDQILGDEDTFDLQFVISSPSICKGESITYNTKPTPGKTTHYFNNIELGTNLSGSFTPDSSGVFKAILEYECCIIIDSVFIEVVTEKKESVNYLLCENGQVSVNGTSYTQPGTYLQEFSTNQGCDSILEIQIIRSLRVFNLKPTQTSCGLNNGKIEIEAQGNGLTYMINNGLTQISSTFDNLSPGTYLITITDEIGCSDTISTKIEASPTIKIQDIITEIDKCKAGTGSIEIIMSPQGNYQYLLNNDQNVSANISNLNAGQYKYTITDGRGCSLDTLIDIPSSPEIIITSIAPTPTECQKSNGQIIISANAGTGPLSIFINDKTYNDTIVLNLEKGSYEIILVDQYGCEKRTSIDIDRDKCPIFLPNIINGNGSSVNNAFKLITIDDYDLTILKYKIYDRWGNLVYLASNFKSYDNSYWWDGSFKNRPAELGVYTYIIDVLHPTGDTESISGDVTLIR